MKTHNKLPSLLAIALTTGLTTTVGAHSLWIVPSQTQLSGEDAWVTFDAAASNQLFVANHASLDLPRLKIWAPNNEAVEQQNAMQGKVRSVFDLALTQKGTYQVIRSSNGVFARYEKDGEKKRWWGSVDDYYLGKYPNDITADDFGSYVGQTETFVTLGEPTTATVAPAKYGLDIEYLTHPNALYSGETAKFRVLIDGKPTAGVAVEIIKGNSQYRNNPDAIKITSDANGDISVNWNIAGMYWLNAESEDNKGLTQNKKRSLGYTAVLEVLPE